jgi:hypothetical protein
MRFRKLAPTLSDAASAVGTLPNTPEFRLCADAPTIQSFAPNLPFKTDIL